MSDDEPRETPSTVSPSGPVKERNRIGALDVVRGFALLGILFVNMRFFAMPLGLYEQWLPAEDATTLDVLAHWFIKIFCESKFYPLYAMLFGMGLVLQRTSALKRGRAFVPLYLRRLAVLFAIGLVHAILLWYGDILVVYSVAGLTLLCFARATARSLITVGVVLIGLTTVVIALVALVIPPTVPADAASVPILTEGTPLARLFETFQDTEHPFTGPADPRWMAYETEAYREGPFVQALGFRAMSYVGSIVTVYILGGVGLHVLGMFSLGAGLMKVGIFDPDKRALRRRLALAGLLVGLPLVVVGAFLPLAVAGAGGEVPRDVLQCVGGSLMSLGYLAGVILLVQGGRFVRLTRTVASAGRMGLTGYLSETLLVTGLMYWWGFGLFGTISPAGEVGLTLVAYAAVVLISTLWLRVALFGPLEWAWRWLTYLRRPPLLRGGGA